MASVALMMTHDRKARVTSLEDPGQKIGASTTATLTHMFRLSVR